MWAIGLAAMLAAQPATAPAQANYVIVPQSRGVDIRDLVTWLGPVHEAGGPVLRRTVTPSREMIRCAGGARDADAVALCLRALLAPGQTDPSVIFLVHDAPRAQTASRTISCIGPRSVGRAELPGSARRAAPAARIVAAQGLRDCVAHALAPPQYHLSRMPDGTPTWRVRQARQMSATAAEAGLRARDRIMIRFSDPPIFKPNTERACYVRGLVVAVEGGDHMRLGDMISMRRGCASARQGIFSQLFPDEHLRAGATARLHLDVNAELYFVELPFPVR